ncbi:thiamine phosphate synthase [Snuella sedimenti]|uniref:Thiamine-phosphate synthase n=1 Tax=Snuella sedimenti TaxID=2798802 RepID=A0A8J7LNN6_9FLAO|nr:thiamine phosphate synthase [Snuella sedimenti]MBJ6368173.1 thiamine phosphate synthase [Snuella sedimenti]
MIPKLHYISQGETPQAHLDNIQKACTAGAELVQLRLKNRSEKQVLQTAEKAREITSHFQTRLIINDYYKVAHAVKADGVHLGKLDTCPTIARKHLASWQLIGGTANTIQDCEVLINKSVDYIGLGPFRFTKTKTKLSPVLGISGYAGIVEALQRETPIIAIGGITLEDVTDLINTGVYGIAASGAITNNVNSINSFHKLLQAPSVKEQIWKVNRLGASPRGIN